MATRTPPRSDAEEAPEDEAGGQRVGHAALEDQVGVHQPVADDGPTEGERQKDQREAGQVGEQAGRVQVEEEGNGVKQREGQNGQQRSARDPLQLLAQQRRVGAAVAAQEEQGGQHVKDGVVGGAGLVEPVLEQAGGLRGCQWPRARGRAGRRRARRSAAAASGGGCS